jgi:hypothetical protein
MRESQMKKIIAVAVASAFALPTVANAAEVTIGGHLEYVYTIADGADDDINTGETELTVTATEELDNGVTVTGTIQIVDDVDNDVLDNQGTKLAFSGAFGTVTVGDTSGALDATGDWTDIASSGGGFNGDGKDNDILYKLPTLVEGLTVQAGMSPDSQTGSDMGTGDADDSANAANSFSLTYSAGALGAYYGVDDWTNAAGENGDKITAYGFKYSTGPIYVAIERAKYDDNGTKYDIDGLAAKYTMGDIVFGVEKQQYQTEASPGTNDLQNEVVMFAEYNLGDSVDIYISSVNAEESKVSSTTTKGSTTDSTRIGVEYVF